MTVEEQRAEREKVYQETLIQMEELRKKVNQDKYKEQGYASGTTVEIPSELFTQITNYLSQQAQSNRSSMQVLEALEMAIAPINLKLMEIHLDNVDKGNTSSFKELDKQDAKAKIKEVK